MISFPRYLGDIDVEIFSFPGSFLPEYDPYRVAKAKMAAKLTTRGIGNAVSIVHRGGTKSFS